MSGGEKNMHPRAVLRRAVCGLLRAAGFPGPVYPNREEPWLAAELPAAGVYTTAESALDTDQSPPPDERGLTLTVDVLDEAAADLPLDDRLDALALLVERALTFQAVERAGQPVMVLDLSRPDTAVGFADNGERLCACATLTYTLSYRAPQPEPGLDLFATGGAGWDLADFPPPHGGPDGRLEAKDIILLPQEKL